MVKWNVCKTTKTFFLNHLKKTAHFERSENLTGMLMLEKLS